MRAEMKVKRARTHPHIPTHTHTHMESELRMVSMYEAKRKEVQDATTTMFVHNNIILCEHDNSDEVIHHDGNGGENEAVELRRGWAAFGLQCCCSGHKPGSENPHSMASPSSTLPRTMLGVKLVCN